MIERLHYALSVLLLDHYKMLDKSMHLQYKSLQ